MLGSLISHRDITDWKGGMGWGIYWCSCEGLYRVNIEGGWCHAGLSPFNPQKLLRKVISTPQSTTPPLPAPSISTSFHQATSSLPDPLILRSTNAALNQLISNALNKVPLHLLYPLLLVLCAIQLPILMTQIPLSNRANIPITPHPARSNLSAVTDAGSQSIMSIFLDGY